MQKNVETIVLIWAYQSFDSLLQYIPNIKHLKIFFSFANSQSWIENVYPNLESLEYYQIPAPEGKKLKNVLRLNPNVRYVSLFMYAYDI